MATGRLRRRLYGLSFIDEFGPVYAVWTLWFDDHGVSTSRISTAFLVWAAISIALEVPSGALADRVDRRYVLAGAFVLRATGIAVWLLSPTFTGLMAGAALWAAHDALASGTWEAFVHDQLAAIGDERHYASVMARIGQFSNVGVAAGTLLGAGLLGLGTGLAVLGWLTVAAHAGSVGLVVSSPDVRWVVADAARSTTDRGWWPTLRRGVHTAVTVPVVGRLVLLGALLEGLFLLDEYVPLLSRARGGADASASIIVLVVWVGLLAGGEVAARRPDLPGRTIGTVMLLGVAVTATAFLTGAVWTLGLLAFGYAVHEVAWIAADARLQARAEPATRATVTSVRGFGSATFAMAFFAVVALLADGDDPTPGLLVAVGVLAATAVLVIAWLPDVTGRDRSGRGPRRDR